MFPVLCNALKTNAEPTNRLISKTDCVMQTPGFACYNRMTAFRFYQMYHCCAFSLHCLLQCIISRRDYDTILGFLFCDTVSENFFVVEGFVIPAWHLRSYRLAAAANWDWGKNPLEQQDNLAPKREDTAGDNLQKGINSSNPTQSNRCQHCSYIQYTDPCCNTLFKQPD